jgi:hypothetical protein
MSLILDGTNGLSDVDGSAATPAIRGSDANTGVFFGTDIVGLSTDGTERMRIDSSGNVAIGTSSPLVESGYATLRLDGSSGSIIDVSAGGTSTGRIQSDANSLYLFGIGARPIQFWTNSAERARIDSSGALLVGTTTSLANGATISGGAGPQLSLNTTTRFTQLNFYNTGSQKGFVSFDNTDTRLIIQNASAGVYLSSGATSWTSNSDERKKDIIEPIENATQKLSSLRTVIGKYKTDADGVRRSFLIAQDVLAVFPEAVDAANAEDLGVAYADLIPVLVKAIQEQQAIITALTARVEALEGAQA